MTLFGRVAEFYRASIGSDSGFVGVLSSNPVDVDHFETAWVRPAGYELRDLARALPRGWRLPAVPTTDAGRNAVVFRAGLKFAGNRNRSDAEVEAYIYEAAAAAEIAWADRRHDRLTDNEIRGVVRSVNRYRARWRARGWHDPRWLARQGSLALRGNAASLTVRRGKALDRDAAILTARAAGATVELTRYGGDITLWGEESTMPKTRAAYPLEFRGQMIELVRAGRSPEALGREFEPSAQAIRNWVRQADRDAGRRADGLTTAERREMQRLRRENATLREEREILKKAAAWFARETGAVPSRSSRSSERTGRSMP